MFIFGRLGRLEAQVAALQKELAALDVVEMERMRGSVLNALRALRRTQQAQEERETNHKGPEPDDAVGRLLATRRGAHGLL